jgi:dCTP deaminase
VLLPDHEIRRLCQRNSLLSPFNEEQLNPASYDVRLGTQIMVEVAQTSELQKIQLHGHTPEDPFWIQPGEFFLAETMEIFNPGFFGSRLTMELRNQRRLHPLPIWPGLRIGQMKFLLVSGRVEKSYAQTGRYNADLGVTASKG